MSNIAIIPARSGSKRLKDKNIRDLCGKPLLAYSIEAAIKSKCFTEVMVSTDSEKYAEIAKRYGAKVPFLRSEYTSSDTVSSWEMVDEVLEGYQKKGVSFESFCLLQPTSPLRDAKDIVNAYKLYQTKAEFAVVSVCKAEHSPLWCGRLPLNHELVNFIDPKSLQRRQAGEVFYRINGAIYIAKCQRFEMDKYIYQHGSFAYIMDQYKSVDIDTEFDFKIAEILMHDLIFKSKRLI